MVETPDKMKKNMSKKTIFAMMACCVSLCAACSDSGTDDNEKNKPHRPDIETQVIAHRGYWDKAGSAQNSIASLKAAQDLGVYGSEFDVNMTADDRLVVVHGPSHGNIADVRTASFDEVRAVKLSNGEPTPTFEEYLEQGAKNDKVKLICEIKDHATSTRETQVVEAVLAAVEKAGMQDRIEYIAFSRHVCAELVRLCPGVKVAYLNGDLSPAELKEMGITGLDYQKSKMEEQRERHGMGRRARCGLCHHGRSRNAEICHRAEPCERINFSCRVILTTLYLKNPSVATALGFLFYLLSAIFLTARSAA